MTGRRQLLLESEQRLLRWRFFVSAELLSCIKCSSVYFVVDIALGLIFPLKLHISDRLLPVHPKRQRFFAETVPKHAHNLLEYGLHDCRLVCWRWYEASQYFPVKFRDVQIKQLEEIVEAFPNTVRVYMNTSEMAGSDATFFENLSRLPNLESLRFDSFVLSLTSSNQPYLKAIPQLAKLTLFLNRETKAVDLIASLKYLTNLTKLKVTGVPFEYSPAEPFDKLKKIRELQVDFNLFTDSQGTRFFPSLTNLTRLELESRYLGQDNTLTTEAIGLYASSLQYLGLDVTSDPSAVNFVPLKSLKKLRTLSVDYSCAHLEGFWETLERMRFITKLTGFNSGFMVEVLKDSIVTLTRLKALDFEGYFLHGRNAEDIPLASRMTQLTELTATVEGKLLPKLSCLTRMVRLKLEVASDSTCSLNEALSCMPKLKSLKICFRNYYSGEEDASPNPSLGLSSDALEGMSQLKSISLTLVDVDKLFFQQLASTAKLTKLQFRCFRKRIYSRSFLSQINLLSDLEKLKLNIDMTCNVDRVLSPQRLPKLKRLDVHQLEARQENALRRRFACLGQVLVNHDRSPWVIDSSG